MALLRTRRLGLLVHPGGAGDELVFEVPAGNRCVLRDIQYLQTDENGQVFIYVQASGVPQGFWLVAATVTASEPQSWSGDVVLEEFDRLMVGTSAGHIRIYASGAQM